jgi:anti-anti-sigma factor
LRACAPVTTLVRAASWRAQVVESLHSRQPVECVVLSMAHVSSVDVSGLEVLQEQHKRLTQAGKGLVLCGLTRQPLRMLSRAGFLDEVSGATPPPWAPAAACRVHVCVS